MKRALTVFLTAILSLCGASAQDSPMNEHSVRMLRNVIPAVVCITIEGTGRADRKAGDDLFDELFATGAQGRRTLGTGSGFFTSGDGYVVTNEHVVSDAAKDGITVTTHDGKTFSARLIKADAKRDLALRRSPRRRQRTCQHHTFGK